MNDGVPSTEQDRSVNMSWLPVGNQTEEPNSWPEYQTSWLQYQQQRALLALWQINL